MDASFLKVLRCPLHPDAGPLEVLSAGHPRLAGAHGFSCPRCGQFYPVIDGIADMLVPSAPPGSFREREMQQWDRQAARYDEGRLQDPIYMAAIDAAARSLRPRPGDLILDAGCGTGLTVRQYYRPGMRVIALDLSLESLRYLRSLCRGFSLCCVRADLTMLPFAPGMFDRVLCANALQQIPEAQARQDCLRELARVARAQATVVVSVQNLSIPKQRAGWRKENTSKGPSGAVQYTYRYEAAEFRALLASELRVEKVRGAGLPLWYRWKLSRFSRSLERWVLSRLPASAHWGHMLIGTGRKVAATPGRQDAAACAADSAALSR